MIHHFFIQLPSRSRRNPLNFERRAPRQTDIFFDDERLGCEPRASLPAPSAGDLSALGPPAPTPEPSKATGRHCRDDRLADSRRQVVFRDATMEVALGGAHRLDQGGILRQLRKDCRRIAVQLLRPRLGIGKAVLQ
jgi:hypothetical protein